MKIKLVITYKDSQDGSATIGISKDIASADKDLCSTAEEREHDPYEKGFAKEVEIEVDEAGNLLKRVIVSTDD